VLTEHFHRLFSHCLKILDTAGHIPAPTGSCVSRNASKMIEGKKTNIGQVRMKSFNKLIGSFVAATETV
jgi:hypothetical protein